MNTGDRIVRGVLSDARRTANRRRLLGLEFSDFEQGMDIGQVIIADNYLGANPLLAMAAKNELHFLGLYAEARS